MLLFNTCSHNTVLTLPVFKYIQCYYSTGNSSSMPSGMFNLNTSNVIIQRKLLPESVLLRLHLNTSNVIIQLMMSFIPFGTTRYLNTSNVIIQLSSGGDLTSIAIDLNTSNVIIQLRRTYHIHIAV